VSTASEREMYKVGLKTLAYLGVGTHWQKRVNFTVYRMSTPKSVTTTLSYGVTITPEVDNTQILLHQIKVLS